MRVLYLDGVGAFGGASRSLYEALSAMPEGAVEPHFVVQRGTVVPLYRSVARDLIAVRGLTRFDNTRFSHYSGVRWLILLRELAHLPFTLLALIQARVRWRRVDVIHANEVTEIIPLLIARRLFAAPTVVHVRSLTYSDPSSRRCRWLTARLRRDVDALIAIDQNVRATLPEDVTVDVVHNSFTPRLATTAEPELLSKLEALRVDSLKVGFVGNLHLSKGIFELVEAARILKGEQRNIEFLVVGGGTRSARGPRAWLLAKLGLAQNVHDTVAERVAQYGLTASFHLLGPTSDIHRVYERLDVLCFPSHFDAPGRPVFEAAFSGVPSITAVRDPRPDTLVHGETGLAITGKDPVGLARAIAYCDDNRGEVARMGVNARRLAERNFDARANARKLLGVYRRLRQAGSDPRAPRLS